MHIVFLKLTDKRTKAPEFMTAHQAWIKQGVADGVFQLVGSLQPNLGGCIIANDIDKQDLEIRLNQDPFVIEDIVTTEIYEVSPAITTENLKSLMEN